MCNICSDFNNQKLTIDEAFRNLYEISDMLSKKHFIELTNVLIDALRKEELDKKSNEELEIDLNDFWYDDQEDWSDIDKKE